MQQRGKIFLFDDQPSSREHLQGLLEAAGFACTPFHQAGQVLKALEESRDEPPDLVILDARPAGEDGLELLRRIKTQAPDLPAVLLSGFATVRHAVEAMKLGAADYLARPVLGDDLLELADKLVERRRLVAENRALKAEIRKRFDPDQVVFSSAAFRQAFELAKKVAPSEASVLIQGESGTGKELIASTIHYSSRRSDRRFLTINCAALTDTLLESQLFGHLKGSFTGAVANQRGLVEEASQGTLFLDEIGDISPALQAKLLRLLQEKEFIPVGSTRIRHADVRFLAATNKNLEAEVKKGHFREDLYFRLNVVNLQVPPLRERREDIPPLARFFLSRYATRADQKLAPGTLERLRQYDWPGNVRELENVIEMAAILADGATIEPRHLPLKVAEGSPVEFSLPQEELSMAEVEKRYIAQVFRQTRHHKLRTSKILGISRKTLDRKLQQYGIGVDEK